MRCPAGHYAPVEASANCTQCARTQYQPLEGEPFCYECTGTGMIGNNERTGCLTDPNYEALAESANVIEELYTKGIALSGAFVIAIFFVLVASGIHFKKVRANTASQEQEHGNHHPTTDVVAVKKNDQQLLGVVTPVQTVVTSGMTGFSFGSELFLIIGLLGDAPVLAAVMLIFRLSHVIIAGLLLFTLFGSSDTAEWIEKRGLVKNAKTAHLHVHEEFCRRNMPLLSAVVLLSLFDVSLMRFLPWRASEVYTESQGFPSLTVLRWCLGTDTLQATVSVTCQLIFLATSADLDAPNTGAQAKALFALNITFAVMGAVAGCVTLCLKNGLLDRLEEKMAPAHHGDGSDGRDTEIESIYKNEASAIELSFTGNPLHDAIRSNSAPDETAVHTLVSENESLKKSLNELTAAKELADKQVVLLENELQKIKKEEIDEVMIKDNPMDETL